MNVFEILIPVFHVLLIFYLRELSIFDLTVIFYSCYDEKFKYVKSLQPSSTSSWW